MRLPELRKGLTLLLIGLMLVACSIPPQQNATSTPGAVEEAIKTAAAAATATAQAPDPTPEASPTPDLPSKKVLLIAPPGASLAQISQLQTTLHDLAEEFDLVFETVETLQASDLTPEVFVTVWLDAPGNLSELASGAPQTQFIVFTPLEMQAGANVSVLRLKTETQAFVAGFVVALLSPDYRAAGLLPSDGPLGSGLAESFINGGRYFCGVCAPGWPLREYYPQAGELPAGSTGDDWQATAAGLLEAKVVDAMYLSPEATRSEVLAYLSGKTQYGIPVKVVGAEPPPAEIASQWAATVHFDLSDGLRSAWSLVMEGNGGITVDVPVTVDDVNPSILSEAKLRLVHELIEEIKAGRIYTYTIPAQ